MRPEAGDDAAAKGRLSPWRLVPILVLVAGLVLFFVFDLGRFVSPDALKEHHATLKTWVADKGAFALLAYMLVYAVLVAFSVPGGAVMTVAGGLLFGAVVTTATVVIAATAGATAVFLAVKWGLGDALRARAGPTLKKMEAGFRENALSYLLVLRLVPLFPFWLVNLAPAFLGVPLRTYVFGTLVGIVPGTFVFALVGNGAGAVLEAGGTLDFRIIFRPEILAPIVGLAALALIPVIYKRLRARRGAA